MRDDRGGDEPRETGTRGARALPPTLKRFGQHFLSDQRVLARIADALQLTGAETVVEIGPGRGALTDVLAARAARLVAVELDRQLAAMLRERYASQPHVTIVEADVLSSDLGALAGGPYVLAGNVPYYITTPIIFRALEAPRPARMAFLVQREVAERLGAAPGSKTYGALSVNAQTMAAVEVLFRVPAGAFVPPPKVESAVVRLTPRSEPLLAPGEEDGYRRFVQAAFGMRRKQLARILRSVRGATPEEAEAMLADVGIARDARPETLGVETWVRLYRRVAGATATGG
ncbi:MAG TPA: 16S rRNA (adenine(1518)-N(6)/adenine(1519)-N(6))-dimethyltransferase RsmA [Gemmatimonadaceae bacterium]|nr:16S rRNA (adenine(1518)-N(6)/adenine(1519)-N(6))-dimethyltransferase RsmA [Gemmatimonadaceae bacterium]